MCDCRLQDSLCSQMQHSTSAPNFLSISSLNIITGSFLTPALLAGEALGCPPSYSIPITDDTLPISH